MSLVPMKSTTCETPARESTSRSSRSTPGGDANVGLVPARVTVLPPMPSLTTEKRTGFCNAKRWATRSSQRSWESSVEQVPSVMESPKAMMALAGAVGCTSIDLSQNIEVVVRPAKALPSSDAV